MPGDDLIPYGRTSSPHAASPSLDGECRDGRHAMPARVSYEDTDFSGTSELRVVPQYGKIDS